MWLSEWDDCGAKLPLYKALMSYPVRSHTFQGRDNQVLQEVTKDYVNSSSRGLFISRSEVFLINLFNFKPGSRSSSDGTGNFGVSLLIWVLL